MPNTPNSGQDAHAKVKTLLSERGVTFSRIAQTSGVEITAILRASSCQTRVTENTIRLRHLIADAVGEPASSIWPAQYLEPEHRGKRRRARASYGKQVPPETVRRIQKAVGARGMSIASMAERYNVPISSLTKAINGLGKQDHLRFIVADVLGLDEKEIWPDLYDAEHQGAGEVDSFRKPSAHTDQERRAIMGLPASPAAMREVIGRITHASQARSA